MAADFTLLQFDFRLRVFEAIRICLNFETEVLCYCTIRTPEEQAILFRKSRTRKEIKQRIQSMTDKGFPFFAETLSKVGPQSGVLGKHLTNAAPGESWHQYGLACDCVPVVAGKALWNDDAIEWTIYGGAAEYTDLTWAGNWSLKSREYPHIQRYRINNPLSFYQSEELARASLVAKASTKGGK